MVPFLLSFVHFVRVFGRLLKQREFRALLTLVASTLALGAWFYHVVEGWNWLDSFYFCVTTLTTVGYGDLAPKTGMGKIFTIIYIFAGLGLLVGFVEVIGKHVVQSRINESKPSRGNLIAAEKE